MYFIHLFIYKFSEERYYLLVLRESSAALKEERKRSLKHLRLEG